MSRTRIALLGVVALLVIGGGVVGGYAIKYYTADVRGRIDANEQILSGDSRIANYNHFFNLCASIQGNEAQVDALLKELETASGDDESRVRANITGVKAARLGAIAQYNADAAKDYTAGQFRDSDLPYQIPATDYPTGGKTSCYAF